jgi:dimethylamine/trimethylamine dehydrogenase
MTRDPRYDILFEPVKIGPVTAPNRFYQVPHCNGMGHVRPKTNAAMRGMKAAGGWGVVCTEEVEIHPTSDIAPYIEGRLWDDADIPYHALMVDAVHEHGSLAAIELCHNGLHAANYLSREVPIGPRHFPVDSREPLQAREMDLEDIRDFRSWHRAAVRRSLSAGYDIIYSYAGHDLTLQLFFINPRYNQRSDEYGGSLENRTRLLRETIEDAREEAGDRAAIAVRFAVDELLGDDGMQAHEEGRGVVELLAELPDLWDVNVSDWPNDSTTSRFTEEGSQEDYIAFVKQVTSKPVVGVGRFTSPDTMVSQIKRGILDFIGAARPSIADPFLPKKIEEGRPEDIRECIGCNICVSHDYIMTPLRCTQNPTMGEEWRKDWHPDSIAPKGSDDAVLVVGGGPAGLEAARALGQRGYAVTLAETGSELGGRVARECRLPGLSAWGRVRDYRAYQLSQMANVDVYLESKLDADAVREMGAARVVLATGSHWVRDGQGRAHHAPVPGCEAAPVYSPDDVMNGTVIGGPVVIFDDDHYYMGGVLAELLRGQGAEVTLVTTASDASSWTHNTMEQGFIQARLLELGVEIKTNHNLVSIGNGVAELACTYTDRIESVACAATVMVTMRLPDDALYHALMADPAANEAAGITSIDRIGDGLAPATIAAAVYAGHRYARELDEPPAEVVAFKRETVGLG